MGRCNPVALFFVNPEMCMNAKKEEKLDKFYREDVKALNGCYDYTLKEISAIIPRYESRKRAYAGLTRYLKKYKGIDLIIKSQKG